MKDEPALFPAPDDEVLDKAEAAGSPSEDTALNEVVTWFRGQPDMGRRFGAIFRQSIDEVLDGQRTGRFDLADASVTKTERTYLGTKVEIVTRAAFELPLGEHMDYSIAGHEVDAKFSLGGVWAIPTEAVGHLCLLMAANDAMGVFRVGVVRISAGILNPGANKDQKKTISKEGRKSITWLVAEGRLPPNLLLRLPPDDRQTIMSKPSGQQRINELLRRVQGVVIDRNTAVTVARQHDGLKRCRDARRPLAAEGIVVLGHQNQSPIIAKALRLPVPVKGTFLSVRLTEVDPPVPGRATVYLAGRHYAVALRHEPPYSAPPIRY